MKRYAAMLSALVLLAFATAFYQAAAANRGLSSGQVQQLRTLGFAVVPEPPPAGFTVQSVHVDRARQTYDIRYRGPRGSTMDLSGRLANAPGPAETPHPHGLFQNIGSAFSHLHLGGSNASLHNANNEASANANDKSGKAGEEQEEMTGVGAYNPTLGPVNFDRSGSCLHGTNDPSRAQIHNAAFTLSGCNMHAPDALIRAYKTLTPIH